MTFRPKPPQQTETLLVLLQESGFVFVVVGGVAAVAHGSPTFTADLDVAAPMTAEKMAALRPYHPTHVLDPPEHLATFRMLLLATDLGRLDVLGTVDPVGGYASIRAQPMELVPGRVFPVIDLEQRIAVKAHVARPKDRQVELELRAILDLKKPGPR